MEIDLTDPNNLTVDSVRKLIASGDDRTHTQLRVTKKGIAYLSKVVGAQNIGGLAFRLETFDAGNDYVGPAAAKDNEWVERIFRCLKTHWPHPASSHIDHF